MSDTAVNNTAPAGGNATPGEIATAPPVSIFRKRVRKFKTLKRGYYSFVVLTVVYALSFLLPLFVGKRPVILHYKGETYFPAFFSFNPGSAFGQTDPETGNPLTGEADYRKLSETLADSDDGWMVMPLYTWDPYENDYNAVLDGPSSEHLLGTDDIGRDVFARMCYGFRISLSFALILVFFEYLIGTAIGSAMGYFGGRLDLYGLRLVEIWSNIPFLYTVIIVSSIVQPSFLLLILLISLFDWVGVTYYMRGEFYREKAKDYVAAAIALGVPSNKIIFKHILPNALTPLIARLPFSIIAGIFSLVSLDYLASWGQMVGVGLQNVDSWWLVVVPISAMFITLLLITFIGEAIREAFDPRVYSRLQ